MMTCMLAADQRSTARPVRNSGGSSPVGRGPMAGCKTRTPGELSCSDERGRRRAGAVSAYMARSPSTGAQARTCPAVESRHFRAACPTSASDQKTPHRPQRITSVTASPYCRHDTGWGSSFNIARTIRSMERRRRGDPHEDQYRPAMRHRPVSRLFRSRNGGSNQVRGRREKRSIVQIGRTDALANEGLTPRPTERAVQAAGADMLFPGRLSTRPPCCRRYRRCHPRQHHRFGKTPLFGRDTPGRRVDLVPSASAFRALSKAAQTVYESICRTAAVRT